MTPTNITRLKTTPRLRAVGEDEPMEKIFGSPEFIARSRNPALVSPRRFEPTVKGSDDVVI